MEAFINKYDVSTANSTKNETFTFMTSNEGAETEETLSNSAQNKNL